MCSHFSIVRWQLANTIDPVQHCRDVHGDVSNEYHHGVASEEHNETLNAYANHDQPDLGAAALRVTEMVNGDDQQACHQCQNP